MSIMPRKIDSSISDYIYNIDLSYDLAKVFEEVKDTPMAEYRPQKPYKDSWFKNTKTWLHGRIENIGPEVQNIVDQIKELTESKDVVPKLVRQLAGSALPLHTDLRKVDGTTDRYNLCAVNIQLTTEVAPGEFEEIGVVEPYRCALLNVIKRHGVPMVTEERIFIKNSIYDIPYDVALSNYLKNK